jgi:hypothetical protein
MISHWIPLRHSSLIKKTRISNCHARYGKAQNCTANLEAFEVIHGRHPSIIISALKFSSIHTTPIPLMPGHWFNFNSVHGISPAFLDTRQLGGCAHYFGRTTLLACPYSSNTMLDNPGKVSDISPSVNKTATRPFKPPQALEAAVGVTGLALHPEASPQARRPKT